MASKRIYQLGDIGSYTNIDDGDFLHISDNSDGDKDKKVSILNIMKKILGNRAFGGSGNIVTADASSQTMSNKRIDNIRLNSATTITANGADINKLSGMTATTAELNKLHGVTASTAEFNYLTGVTHSIQTQINEIANQSQGVTNIIYHYSPGVISGVTSQIINEATLRAEYGINSSYRVDPDSISVSVYKLESERWYLLPPALSSEGIIFFNTTTAGPASQTVLNSINVTLSSSESYRIVVNYKVLALAGV